MPSAFGLDPLDPGQARRVRVDEGLLQDRGHPVDEGLRGGVGAALDELEQLGLIEVLGGPLRHEQRGIALVDRLAGEQTVALIEDVLLVAEDREVLVLERVVELVSEGEPFVDAGLALLREHVQGTLVVAIEADDAAAQEIERQLAQIGVGGDQAERLVEPFGRGDVLGGSRLVEVGCEERS